MLSWLKANAPQARVIVVANKVQANLAEISRSDFEASIETDIDVLIPYDIKAASMAAKLGQTFVDANRSSKAAGAMRDLARKVSEREADASASGKKSLLGKLDFKSMMSKAKKAEPAE